MNALWQPTESLKEQSNLTKYMRWLEANLGLSFMNYHALWQWSVDKPNDFWVSLLQYFELDFRYSQVCEGTMPQVKWFEGARLNFAQEVFKHETIAHPAILFQMEGEALQTISWQALREQVAALSTYLRSVGVQQGDRVVGYLPNCPQATVALLATLSIGAVWSSASPDFGVESVQERFEQISPKVLIAVNGYRYGGKVFDKTQVVNQLQQKIASIEHTVLISYLPGLPTQLPNTANWAELIQNPNTSLHFTLVPFDHPIWVLYSSGTTGIPKAITHSQGGILLDQLKSHILHDDLKPGDRYFWFSTTGWMMWNHIQGTLLAGCTMVLYDGNPGYPDMTALWRLVEQARINYFGTSAAFVLASMKADVNPQTFNLASLRAIGVTGSPLPKEGFEWIYKRVKPDVWLVSLSGGTDVCSAFVAGCVLLPVYAGEIQCRTLGAAIEAFDVHGKPLYNEVGELVITRPMPNMPVFFWNDPDYAKYTASYFDEYPGVWRHGDWVQITNRQSVVILGRSDATLNRHGIRIGTSEIYRSVEKINEVQDSLILNIEKPDGTSWMPLFVQLKQGVNLDNALIKRIAAQLRADYSPRHVPDEVIEVNDIPYTISGKKVEVPLKKIFMGVPLQKAVNKGALRNPEALDFFVRLSQQLS